MKMLLRPKNTLTVVMFVLIVACSKAGTIKEPVDYVNPYMGNISHLLVPTTPIVHLPGSMVSFNPARADFTGDLLNGFPMFSQYAFRLSPFCGDEKALKPVISYSYDQEKVTPYSYQVYLDEQGTTVRLALSHQSAIFEIDFPVQNTQYLVISARNGALKWDGKAISGSVRMSSNGKNYIYAEPETQPDKVLSLKSGNLNPLTGDDDCLVLKYDGATSSRKIRYGVSFIDEEQAKKNLQREIKSFDIEQVEKEGRKIWNETLGQVEVEGGTEDERAIFYTSLYRTFKRPLCISEDGRYFSGFDGKIHDDHGQPFYAEDGIWDTYLAFHPLQIILDPEKEENILNSYVLMSEQGTNFWMPTYPGIAGPIDVMNGNHGVAMYLDALKKGLKNFDPEKAYRACKGATTEKTLAPWSGKPAGVLEKFYYEHGYFPALKNGETETVPEVHPFERRQPVAVTLGNSFDCWCLAQLAKQLGKTEDADFFTRHSFDYRNLFNPETGFFHPKDMDGNFIEPFDYVFSGGQGARGYYDENNGWTYRWYVHHNIPDLINLMGGRKKFIQALDDMFARPLGKSKFEFYAQLPDQTGNVGQFSMGNEPSFHIPYLYNFVGQPWKTQKRVRSLLTQWFRNDLMGIPGDEDSGGMSAFVIFSYMGFYPVTPGIPEYNIGSPVFKKIKIHLKNGKIFEVEAKNASSQNKYIQSATFNGNPWNKPWFTHSDLIKGGKLVLEMADKANYEWGASPDAIPPTK
jgi:predicted alpha-1,2-mannosidase